MSKLRRGDYTVNTMPPPSSGPAMQYMLNILEGEDFPFGFSTSLVQLYIAGLPLRSCWIIGAPSVQGVFPTSIFVADAGTRTQTGVI